MLSKEATASKLRSAELLRLGFVMALAMTLHNLPEGFAVSNSGISTDLGIRNAEAWQDFLPQRSRNCR